MVDMTDHELEQFMLKIGTDLSDLVKYQMHILACLNDIRDAARIGASPLSEWHNNKAQPPWGV